jgi:hypothetical protein
MADGEDCDLVLRVRLGQRTSTENWSRLFHAPRSWTLWLDEDGHRVFEPAPASPPQRYVFVDQDFKCGEVLVVPGQDPYGDGGLYPLLNIDIILYANWLSDFGDLIIHASGVNDGGQGYCFVGPSGVGKSTLASAWTAEAPGTVLGEDQVILRHVDGCFWIFGTPWHERADRCSPEGVPLSKVFFLERDGAHGIQPCDPDAAAIRLLQNSFAPLYHAAGMSNILGNLARLIEQVPFYRFRFRPQADVLRRVRQTR